MASVLTKRTPWRWPVVLMVGAALGLAAAVLRGSGLMESASPHWSAAQMIGAIAGGLFWAAVVNAARNRWFLR